MVIVDALGILKPIFSTHYIVGYSSRDNRHSGPDYRRDGHRDEKKT